MTFRPTEATLFVEKTTAPTANDDQNEGFLVGDLWMDETGDEVYQCLDVTVGAAVWRKLSGNDSTLSDVDYIDFNTGLEGGVAFREGRIFWDEVAKTLACRTESSDVTLQIGQEQHVRCTNKSGGDISDGQLVYNDGALGHKPTIALADADTLAAVKGFGFATEDIADNATGYVTTFGLVRNIDTSACAAGDILWLSSTPGGFTSTRPIAPTTQVRIGYCLYSHATEGIAFCHVHGRPRLRGLSDVYSPTTPNDKAMVAWDTGNARFKIIGQGDLDHGSISGLGDSADHTWALLIDGTRNLTGNLTQNDGLYFATDEVRARDSGGLALKDDSGNLGIFVEDGGVVRVRDSQLSDNRFKINSYGSGNRYAYIDLVGDDTYSDYGFRIIRWDGGANTNSDIAHRGTGNLQIITQEAGAILFKTTNTTRITIAAAGNMTLADGLYFATDEVRARDSGGLYLKDDAGNMGLFIEDSTGDVGIKTNAPTTGLDINDDILRLRTAKTPASASAAGNAGDICWDADNIYICVATNTWKKAAIATW